MKTRRPYDKNEILLLKQKNPVALLDIKTNLITFYGVIGN